MRTHSWMAGLVAVAAALSCSSGDGADADAGPTFIATTGDFDGYHAWPLTWSYTGDAITGSPHTSGPRQVYLNTAPPSGLTEFPVGTIIVKDIGPGPATADVTFAMVKRGGGFNAGGAVGWEWVDLQNNADGTTTILWRGAEPPPGQTYSGDPTACNVCHATAVANDYVNAQPELTSF